jgi:hypothetical protein
LKGVFVCTKWEGFYFKELIIPMPVNIPNNKRINRILYYTIYQH